MKRRFLQAVLSSFWAFGIGLNIIFKMMITRTKGNDDDLPSPLKGILIGDNTYYFYTKTLKEFDELRKILSSHYVVIGGEGLVKGATISYLVSAI